MIKKKGTFIHGDRRVHVFDIPDDELNAWLKDLKDQIAAQKANKKPIPGFIK